MKKKVALIFGVTGQTGSYLARLLLEKKYIVHGVKRRSSSYNTSRIDDIYDNPLFKNKNLYLHFGDVTDTLSVREIIKRTKPNEIYNLAAQSHVHVSFELPEFNVMNGVDEPCNTNLPSPRLIDAFVDDNSKLLASNSNFNVLISTPSSKIK